MKDLTVAVAAAALSLTLVACGSGTKTETKTSTSTSTSTSTFTSTTTAPTSGTPGAQANYTIADYIRDNHIQETPVHHGDPGSPTINLPVPTGWNLVPEGSGAPYGGIVYGQPADPNDAPTIVAIVSKLTGDVDPAKLIQFAPGELKNLPGYDGPDNGHGSTLAGFQAWQLGGSYDKNGKKRAVAQKTVVITSPNGLFVLQLDADALDNEGGLLMDATSIIDEQTTITT
ncbi:hypothetical protein GAN17_04555 [Mycobacterium kubicae]|uniref:LpqN/LpqT family lipoprotein n=1 Tax=Mycobacterium kubicae TaxID=120959 RepID=UPI0016416BD3|nr:LpqN/LpqT family lipoprotein [Mycobacterium kubicae]QNI05642.1 hypothetical protein GAN17_04555 [Mycobacterium kubicae]